MLKGENLRINGERMSIKLYCTYCGNYIGKSEYKDGKQIGDFNDEWQFCPFCGAPFYTKKLQVYK